MSENLILGTANSDESSLKEGDKMEVISDEVSRAKDAIQNEKPQENGPSESSTSGVPGSDDTDITVSNTQSSIPEISVDSTCSESNNAKMEGIVEYSVEGDVETNATRQIDASQKPVAPDTPAKISDTDASPVKICDVAVGEISEHDVNKDSTAAGYVSKQENTLQNDAGQALPSETEPVKPIIEPVDNGSQLDATNPPAQGSPTPTEKLVVDLPSVKPTAENGSIVDSEVEKSDSACAAVQPSHSAVCKKDSSDESKDKTPPESVYHVKWIQFKTQNTAIVTQNENGPCPLLAIMNCLLLQGRVKLPAMMEMVTSGQLMEYLGDCILENAPKDIGEAALLNYEQNMQDAMDVFHKLQTGLDVNVKFTGVSDFEYTRECIVFDLLNIPLYHGWLVDPESPEVVAAVGSCSYNQLVEKIISQKNANREELMTEALIAEEFLERTAAQLSYHGLSELSTTVKEDELCVFFRNNHFSTVYKHKKELFLLVTDQGFLTESNVVWETLSNVEGDGHFVDAQFRTFRKPEPSTAPIAVPEVPVGTDQQIDQDYLVALSLQQEQQVEQPAMPNTAPAWQPTPDGPLEPTLSDHELALRLQEEEDRRAALAANQRGATSSHHSQQRAPLQHQPSTASSSGGSRKKDKSDCIIL